MSDSCREPSKAVERLDLAVAVSLAEAIHAMKNAPRSRGALEATTEDLQEWCSGGEYQGKYWSPENQARWLVREARATWDQWEGPKALHDLFLTRFGRLMRPELQPFQTYEKPPMLCDKCRDQGSVFSEGRYVACDCEVGRTMPAILLRVMNGVKSINVPKRSALLVRGKVPRPSQEEIDPIMQQQRQNQDRPEDPQPAVAYRREG